MVIMYNFTEGFYFNKIHKWKYVVTFFKNTNIYYIELLYVE